MSAEKKYSLKERINIISRGHGVYKAFPQPVILSSALSVIVDAGLPFINLYFSAMILNELTGIRNKDNLIKLVLMTISLNLVGFLIQKALSCWVSYCDKDKWMASYKVLTDKMLSMDFIDTQNPFIQKEYSQIRATQEGQWYGLIMLSLLIPEILKGVIQIILSTALTYTLFTLKVPNDSPYVWLNSWWVIVAVILVFAGPLLLAPYLNLMGGKIFTKIDDDSNKGNRYYFFYFFNMIRGNDSAKDIRIYEQDRLINKHKKIIQSYFGKDGIWDRAAKYNGKFDAAAIAVTYLCNGLFFLFVALKAMSGAFGIGNLVLYVGAVTQFAMGVSSVLRNIGDMFNSNIPFLDKTLKFLDIPNLMRQGVLAVEKHPAADYEFEFRNVSFKYPFTEKYVLKNVNLKFGKSRLAVVGENGSGKSTFIKLLCRLYDPTSGVILLNGRDIREYNYNEYSSVFSIVFQDFKLFPFTLGQNVATKINYEKKSVENVLERVGFGERLAAMPKGLDTYLYTNFESDGVEISGGEAQKIALARALYRNAPFIILDEPTAALDPIAEFEIYSKMNEIVGNKIAIFISHRLSSCRFCDDILVIHNGEVIQRGAHEDLVIEKQGKYFELWDAQARYYN